MKLDHLQLAVETIEGSYRSKTVADLETLNLGLTAQAQLVKGTIDAQLEGLAFLTLEGRSNQRLEVTLSEPQILFLFFQNHLLLTEDSNESRPLSVLSFGFHTEDLLIGNERNHQLVLYLVEFDLQQTAL